MSHERRKFTNAENVIFVRTKMTRRENKITGIEKKPHPATKMHATAQSSAPLTRGLTTCLTLERPAENTLCEYSEKESAHTHAFLSTSQRDRSMRFKSKIQSSHVRWTTLRNCAHKILNRKSSVPTHRVF